MPTKCANIYNLDLTAWMPAKAVWLRFSRDCPQFVRVR